MDGKWQHVPRLTLSQREFDGLIKEGNEVLAWLGLFKLITMIRHAGLSMDRLERMGDLRQARLARVRKAKMRRMMRGMVLTPTRQPSPPPGGTTMTSSSTTRA